ncbi:BnaA05g15030D [Brassica napus]|uniref:Uncharacterized protein n=2 Tax=Brassica TaxID=3705 RepID=M4DCB6_BRACM|nr:unnamed protein product [Brassica napus]CDY41839.1 BnaA08g03340D [Brassica napus]CDY45636.1 BnaA05g15030D [Brassica napus]
MSKNPTDGFNSVIFRFALPLTSFLVHMSSFNGAWSILGGSASAVKQCRLGLLPSSTLLQRLIVGTSQLNRVNHHVTSYTPMLFNLAA